MKNKQHEYILRAFLESKIPESLRSFAPQLMSIDSVIGGYCSQLLKAKDKINILSDEIVTTYVKNSFTQLINETNGDSKDELVIYYRLVILTETILYKYKY